MKKLFLILLGSLLTASAFSQESWSLAGNTGTSISNFIGTTDNMPLFLRANNQWAGFTGYPNKNNVSFGYLSLINALGNGDGNTAVGAQALQWNSEASGNVAVGTWALEWCTEGNNNVAVGMGAMHNSLKAGNHNVAIGQKALANNKQSENTAVGSEAGFSNTEGNALTAVGFRALNCNTTGEFNTAIGYQALLLNTTGYWNVALGSGSLQWNSTGRFNTAGGNSSLHFNRTGVENTAFGEQALGGNIDGSYNTAVGCRSLWSVQHTSGNDSGYGEGNANTAVGYESLKGLTTGNGNTGMGLRALQTNTTGSNNTALGDYADVGASDLTNVTAIGYGAVATASNQVMIGNSKVNSIRGYVSWSTISDRRIKKNIQTDVPGLAFIELLQPVTYNLDLDAADQIVYSGFIAQDVEKAAHSIGYDFSGIDVDKSNNGLYGLRYSEFIVPLVKSVQELSEQNEAKDVAIALLQQQIDELTGRVNQWLGRDSDTASDIKSISIPEASLEQNFPNPFNHFTTIHYTLPQTFRSAKIVVIGSGGRVFEQISLSSAGAGSIRIEGDSLSTGMYYYSLYVDNILIDTKKMIITE